MVERVHKVRTPLFPMYSEVRHLIKVFEGVPVSGVRSLIREMWEQMGTPQKPVDWSDPDTWIPKRLWGKEAELATRIWEESKRAINPRHIYGSYLFINSYELLAPNLNGNYELTDRGRSFLNSDDEVVREIDDLEGIPHLLGILAAKTRGKRSDLLPEWTDFLREHSKFGTASTIRDALRRRLANVLDRGLVQRDGNTYEITDQGTEYASTFIRATADPQHTMQQAINAFNESQRHALKDRLSEMSPYRFEHLVRDLLEAMGYEDVTVTKESGDKGVDVVATVQFGITTITEVVQVKRQKGNISRQVLDQLRGALPYYKAIRGTLITLGNFSKGCRDSALFPGAAPIGLINGDRLLDLLIEHEIGIKKRAVPLHQLDEDFFSAETDLNEVAKALDEVPNGE